MGKILVIAEKPSAGADMAKVLGCTEKKNGYYEGSTHIVTWALGHLVGLKYPEEHDEKYKKWSLETLPFFFDISDSLKVMPETRGQFNIIKSLIKRQDVEYLINAGDAGREGLLIQNWIYRMAGNHKPVKVLWADSLTEETLRKCFQNVHENREFSNLMQEAEARAEGDYIMGMNLSRALTLTRAEGAVLRYGRCQTPVTNLVVMRDLEIENFESTPYYTLEADVIFDGEACTMSVQEDGKTKRFAGKEEADAMAALLRKERVTVTSCQTQNKEKKAPQLYNLITLQKVMGSQYGYSPDKTLEICQALYEKHKILSYPRTDSRALSMDVYREIPEHIESIRFGKFARYLESVNEKTIHTGRNVRKSGLAAKQHSSTVCAAGIDVSAFPADKRYFNDKKVTDHHALIPTIHNGTERIYETLSEAEKNVFDAVCCSLIAIFYPSYQYSATKLECKAGTVTLGTSGILVRDAGWKKVISGEEESGQDEGGKAAGENGKAEEKQLPDLNEGDSGNIADVRREDKKTAPPSYYTATSLLADMEKYNIGTSATTAEILLKIQGISGGKQDARSQYVTMDGKYYKSTPLGRAFMKAVPDKLKDPHLTQYFETQLSEIGEGRVTKEEFLEELSGEVAENIQELIRTQPESVKIQFSGNQNLGVCPLCRQGQLRMNQKSVYCPEYKNGCKFQIWREVAGVSLTEKHIRDLLTKGQTSKIHGFTSSKGSTFHARLALQRDGQGGVKTGFVFDNKGKKRR